MSRSSVAAPKISKGLDYRTIWRWHFYAATFCVPFVLYLAFTGTLFLFHPQMQQWLDRPYSHLSTDGPPASVNDQVKAALAAEPGSNLHAYQLPLTPTSPAEILVGKGLQEFRVYVNPRTLEVLKIYNEDQRLDHFTLRLHGEMLIGNTGSYIVELAASWTVVMILTGLYLWWPRTAEKFAGVFYPRLDQGQRIFWRDIHAVTGIYVSFFALFLLFTGLPWAKSWGSYLKLVRRVAGHAVISADWTTSSAEEKAIRASYNNDPTAGPAPSGTNTSSMPDMKSMDMSEMDMGGGEHSEHAQQTMSKPAAPNAYFAIDKMVASVAPLGLVNPVLVSPPKKFGGNWTARSDALSRPLRVNLVLDGKTGAILKREDFQSKSWIDRAVGIGIAAHEGALFGWANQLVSLFTAVSLTVLSVSGLIMWWRRRPEGVLGAPPLIRRVRFSWSLVTLILALSIYFPFLGGSMILVALAEKFVLRRIPATQRWLGLYGAQA
jgi:uncharacterized iron-regulated membrane protein